MHYSVLGKTLTSKGNGKKQQAHLIFYTLTGTEFSGDDDTNGSNTCQSYIFLKGANLYV